MSEQKKNFATYKEFGKMLREVANLYSKFGDTPLCDSDEEKTYILERINFITPKHAFAECIIPLREMWKTLNFDVYRAKRWGEYVIECEEKGIEPDYDNWK